MAFREMQFERAIQHMLAADGGTGAQWCGMNTFGDMALNWRIALYAKSLGYTRIVMYLRGVDVDRWSKVSA